MRSSDHDRSKKISWDSKIERGRVVVKILVWIIMSEGGVSFLLKQLQVVICLLSRSIAVNVSSDLDRGASSDLLCHRKNINECLTGVSFN